LESEWCELVWPELAGAPRGEERGGRRETTARLAV
jgi:hypothetical protein